MKRNNNNATIKKINYDRKKSARVDTRNREKQKQKRKIEALYLLTEKGLKRNM